MSQDLIIDAVANFYNGPANLMWRVVRSEHMHVGLFDKPNEDFVIAKERTVIEMAAPLALTASSRLLDVGCGVGLPAICIAESFHCSVVGITIASTQVKRGRKLIAEAGLAERIEILEMDVHETAFASNSFTNAMALESLLHMNRPRALREIYRVIAPGGTFTLCDWYARVPLTKKEMTALQSGFYGTVVPLSHYTKLLKDAGFRDVMIEDWTQRVEPTYKHWAFLTPAVESQLSPEFTAQFRGLAQELLSIVQPKLGYVRLFARK